MRDAAFECGTRAGNRIPPRLQDATLKQLDLANVSGVLSTALQVTIASRNPNSRVGVYYDRLDVYASYKYQQVTVGASLPPVYQGHGDVDVWSPVLSGPNVPFAPYLADALGKDVANGYLIMEVKIDGRDPVEGRLLDIRPLPHLRHMPGFLHHQRRKRLNG
ncbi:hypothetical protein EJB05_29404, partial [Eragrostis curvula]